MLLVLLAPHVLLSEAMVERTLPVQRHIGRWNATPTMTPGTGNVIDGPLIANGDAGAALGSSGAETLDFWLGKNDYWADAVDYHWGWVYMHLAGGHLSVSVASTSPPSPGDCLRSSNGNQTMASASWEMEGPGSEFGCASDSACSPLGMLLTDTFFGTADGSFTVSAVPFAAYDLIVYYRMNEEHSFNISSQQCTTGRVPTTVRPLANVNGSFVTALYPSPSNYLRLSGCSGENVTVRFTSGGEQTNHRKSMAGLQIVEAGVSSTAPPRSIGLNIAGKTAHDTTGPIFIPDNVETGVVLQRNWVNLVAPGCGMRPQTSSHFNASQHLFEARIDGTSGRLRTSSIMQANENTLITRLECAECANRQRITISLQLSNYWKLPSLAGVSPTQLWTRHENNYADRNPMALGSCDPHAVFVRGVARFLLKGTNDTSNSKILVVRNGTDEECPMLLPPGAPVGPWATAADKLRLVVRGPCTEPTSKWILEPVYADKESGASAERSQGGSDALYRIRSDLSPELCLGHAEDLSKDRIVYAIGCNSSDEAWLFWTASSDPETGQSFSLKLRDLGGKTPSGSFGCLVSTAGNTNNTLAIVSEVREDGKTIELVSTKTDRKLLAQASFEIETGHTYELVTALLSRRDLAEPGQYRYSSVGEAATADVVAAASHAARAANTSALRAEHSTWWQQFWNKSSVDFGSKYQLLEGWWYGMQYLLGSASRSGEIVPSLFGPWVIKDPPSWVDDITMDYNIEANFYSAGSSNHLELMSPYFETIYSLHDDCAARAASPDWSVPGMAPVPSLGINTYGFECGHHAHNGNSNDNGCPNTLGNYSGIALVNGIGPFAFQRLFHDDSDRFTAALAATPMKQYWEYSRDEAFLAECYEWIRDTAEFYASYVIRNTDTGRLDVPYSCGEEGCVLRNPSCCPHAVQPDQAKNSMADLALARMILKMAAEYGSILNRDSDRWQHWLDTADELAEYPTITDPLSQSEVFAEATDALRNTSLSFGANLEEPMLYLTAVYPAEQIARRRHGKPPSSEEERLWRIANNTLFSIAEYTRRWAGHGAWAPLNGLCQLWPPVARLIDRTSSAAMLEIFTQTLARQMYPNFYPHLDGGGLEQVGAIVVLNEMMLATDPINGFLEFFPLWPQGQAASFVSLRAKGAFVCSGSIDADGTVGVVTVVSERGGNLTFASPESWGGAVPRVSAWESGTLAHVTSVGDGIYRTVVEEGGKYTIERG